MQEKKLMYLVMNIKENVTVSFMGREQDLPLCFAEGMTGAAPVFETMQAAEKWANGAEIIEIRMK